MGKEDLRQKNAPSFFWEILGWGRALGILTNQRLPLASSPSSCLQLPCLPRLVANGSSLPTPHAQHSGKVSVTSAPLSFVSAYAPFLPQFTFFSISLDVCLTSSTSSSFPSPLSFPFISSHRIPERSVSEVSAVKMRSLHAFSLDHFPVSACV